MERCRKGRTGLSVGRTRSQDPSSGRVRRPPVTELCPSWFCPPVGSGGELGWSSLQNTLSLMRWWGELWLKITSRNSASEMSSLDNSASPLSSRGFIWIIQAWLRVTGKSWSVLMPDTGSWSLKSNEKMRTSSSVKRSYRVHEPQQSQTLVSPRLPGCASLWQTVQKVNQWVCTGFQRPCKQCRSGDTGQCFKDVKTQRIQRASTLYRVLAFRHRVFRSCFIRQMYLGDAQELSEHSSCNPWV